MTGKKKKNNRLQILTDKLEKKDLKHEPLEKAIEGTTKSHIMLVQCQMSAIKGDLEEFTLI